MIQAPDAAVLVVDDTQINHDVMEALMRPFRVGVDCAESGEKAVLLAECKRYDLLFIDHLMPDMDGIQTLKAIAHSPDDKNYGVPAVALTANSAEGARRMYLDAGFADYLAKPVSRELLEQMLCRYLPKDKIIRPREPGWVEFCSAAPESQPVQPGLCLDSLGIDVTQAVRNCGGRDMFVSVAREFHRNIEKNAAVIEQFVQKKDIRNYTIQIHALKSSARLIGAGALSEYAAHLEEFGNAGDFKAIQAETPRLLEMYRSYESMVLPEESSDGNEAADKPVISNEELNEAIYGIKEFARVYDLASAGAIVNMLKNYRLPQSFVDTFNLIQDCILCSDQASLLSFLP